MTVAEVIADAESQSRTFSGVTTAQKLAWLSRLQRGYCRKGDFPELKTLAATLSTVANQNYVVLPANFDRFIGRWVTYNPVVVTGGYQPGALLPILGAGSVELEENLAAWRLLGASTPVAVSWGGATGAYRLYLYPTPDTGSLTILYDYWKAPTDFAATSDTLQIPALGDVLVMALCRTYAAWANDERLSYFAQEERRTWNDVQRNYLTQ